MRTRRLRLLTTYATAERSVQPGQAAEFEQHEAEALLAGGYALDETTTEPAASEEAGAVTTTGDDQELETADIEQPETTGRRGGKRR